jgi:hypothetical protein
MQASSARTGSRYIPTPVTTHLHNRQNTISEVTTENIDSKIHKTSVFIQSVSPSPSPFELKSAAIKKKTTTSKLKKVSSKAK